MEFIALVLGYLALSGLFCIILPIGLYIWYRIGLRKEIERRRKEMQNGGS